MKIIHELDSKSLSQESKDLLLNADPDWGNVKQYLNKGQIYLGIQNGQVIAIAVITLDGDQCELCNIAVADSEQGKGHAKQMIHYAEREAKLAGAKNMVVGTGNSSLGQLALYQKCGFRMDSIKKDFFKDYTDVILENGIQCIDMVMLKKDL